MGERFADANVVVRVAHGGGGVRHIRPIEDVVRCMRRMVAAPDT